MKRTLKDAIKGVLRALGWEIVNRRELDFLKGNLHSLAEHLHYVFVEQAIDCVVDVGALRGGYGSLVRNLGYRGPIVSFEPAERSYQELVRASADDPAWNTFRLALGRPQRDFRQLGVTTAREFSPFRPRTAYSVKVFGSKSEVGHDEQVTVSGLDSIPPSFVPSEAQRIFLKVDTAPALGSA